MWYLLEYAAIPMAGEVHQYKYLKCYRRPFSSCNPNKEWPNIALHRYNGSKI